MIESHIIEWLDFYTIQKIEPYSKVYLELYFRFFRTLLKSKNFPTIIDICLIIISFMQIITISSKFLSSDNDILLEIFQYLNNGLLLSNLIRNDNTIYKLLFIISLIIVFDLILMIILLLSIEIIKNKILFNLVNILNMVIYYYLVGPSIDICLNIFLCVNEKQKNKDIKCFKGPYLKYSIWSIIICVLYIFISILYSIYSNEIGSTTYITKRMARVQCNYESFGLVAKILIFIFYYFVKTKINIYIMKLLIEIFISVICIIMLIYVYKNVYYYNNIINFIVYYGWFFCFWFSFCAFLKIVLKLKNITAFILIGWIFFILLFHINIKINVFKMISELKIVEYDNVKSIEIIYDNLIKLLSNKENIKNKLLLHGIIKNFEEYSNNNPEINYHYQKLLNDKYLKKHFDIEDELPILSIIYILYHNQYEKAKNKDEMIIYISYFLIHQFNNPAYAMFFCSKIKSGHHLDLYYKYLLSEDIKDYLINKLNKYSYNESVKHIQIGSPIIYYLYIDLFKLKIYDAICNQIDYFDKLKKQFLTEKMIYKFLKIGISILKIRKEIRALWDKIIGLNPFSEESYKDYMIYLDNILKDDILTKEESKKYILLKNEKIEEKFNIYNSMFLAGKSSIILVDGYLFPGKIIYATPNFDLLLSYNDKEILNINMEDLFPNVIHSFYKELFDEIIKYSNIHYLFKDQILCLLKNKNGWLVNAKIFAKPVPNLCYGLIYFVYLHKIDFQSFVILLDKDLKISGFSEIKGVESSYNSVTGYNLIPGLYGNHIGIIIPNILLLLVYKNGEFSIIKKDSKLKGNLYPINKINKIKTKVEFIINKIKDNKTLSHNEMFVEDVYHIIKNEYNELINELNSEKIKPYNIYYNIKMNCILDGKCKYYKVYINDDIISGYSFNIEYKESLKNSEKISILNYNNSISKESKKQIKKIIENKNIKIIYRIEDNNSNNERISNKDLNENNNIIQNNEENKTNNNKEIELEKKFNINISRTFTSISNNIDLKFNNIKNNIINKKENFPIKIMFYLCIIFGLSTIFFLLFHENLVENSFQKLSNFLDQNIFFNMTKMGVAIIYITSINIKWQLHFCTFNTFYNITLLNEEKLIENIAYLQWIKNFTNNLDIEFDEVVRKKYDIGLHIFRKEETEIYKFNNDNLLNYFVNKAIYLLKKYPTLLQYFIYKKRYGIDPAEIFSDINELDNLANQSYHYFISEINGFTKEEKLKKANKIFINFPYSFIGSGLILFILLIIFIFYTIRINNIESYFIDKIMNYNFYNLEQYIKQLDEIKKKISNDTGEEDDEEKEEELGDINISNSKGNSSKKVEKPEQKETNVYKNKRNNLKKYKNKKLRIKIVKSFFSKKNFFFEIKLIIIVIIYLSYYILSILLENDKEKEFIDFDAINDLMIGVFKESFDNFISFKRQLELYENSLVNCKPVNNSETYIIDIDLISKIKTPNLGNAIMKITSGLGYESESLSNLTEIFNNDACTFLTNSEFKYSLCSTYFWNGILLKGIEPTIVKMGDVIKIIIEELTSINVGGKIFQDIIKSSTYSTYELFIEFYYQKAYRLIDEFFWAIRNGKLYYLLKIIRIILIIYVIISILLLLILIYFVFDMKNSFNSFLNFIAIIPPKYLSEDEYFYNEIIRICSNYL